MFKHIENNCVNPFEDETRYCLMFYIMLTLRSVKTSFYNVNEPFVCAL